MEKSANASCMADKCCQCSMHYLHHNKPCFIFAVIYCHPGPPSLTLPHGHSFSRKSPLVCSHSSLALLSLIILVKGPKGLLVFSIVQ